MAHGARRRRVGRYSGRVRSPLPAALLVATLATTVLPACTVYGPRFHPVNDSLAWRAPPPDDTPYVWVLGPVGQPGRYRVIGDATLTLVLRDAGGIGQGAYHKVIVSRRERGQWVRRVYDVDDIEAGDAEDVKIFPGDVIDAVQPTE